MRRSGLEILEQIFYNDIDGMEGIHSEDYRASKKELDSLLERVKEGDWKFFLELESAVAGQEYEAAHDAFIRGFKLARRLLFPVEKRDGGEQ